MEKENTREALKRLIRLWAIIEDVSPMTIMYRTQKALKIKTFIADENAQKLAVTYLRHLLEEKGGDV